MTLHVTGQRDDGYHLLDSLVVFVDQGDWVSAIPSNVDVLSLSVSGPESEGLSAGNENLVLRAAQMAGLTGYSVKLEKHLPLASGIGGGSADAAAMLRLVARLARRPLVDTAAQLALGADVPVCVQGVPCRMRGVGELLEPLPQLPDFALLLVNPRIALATPSVFRNLSRRDGSAMPDVLPNWHDAAALFHWIGTMRNDLEMPACALAPEIETVLSAIAALPGCALARMSGSGATCFGLFAKHEEATRAAAALESHYPDWWIRSAAVLPA